MKIFSCDHCGSLVYFENTSCVNCGHILGFDERTLSMRALVRNNDGTLVSVGADPFYYYFCQNESYQACNWLVPFGASRSYCLSCSLNRVIPYLGNSENLAHWRIMEQAKRRLVYSLIKSGLLSSTAHFSSSLGFSFLEDSHPENPVMTGHKNGLITINLNEADSAFREQMRLAMGETYRTLLGHMRHESGHYYWEWLITNDSKLKSFRSLFGDESANYSGALERYYAQGPAHDWQANYVSAYASAHPWEDWAETWAHYLHIMATLETSYSFGIGIKPQARHVAGFSLESDPYDIADFNEITGSWFPLTYAMNSINRSMGQADLYPFVVGTTVITKLNFIHSLVKQYQHL